MSASALSAAIRAKKKRALEEEPSESANYVPVAGDSVMASDSDAAPSADPMPAEDPDKQKKHAKIRAMMSKMGK